MSAGNPSVGARFEHGSEGAGLRHAASGDMLRDMSPRGGRSQARRHLLLEFCTRAATAALIAFHAWLFWTHISTGRLLDPAVATRWVVGAGLFAALVGFKRLGVPVLFGRKAAVVWTLVAVLHCHAAITESSVTDQPVVPTVAVLVAPFTLGSAALGLGLLVLTALRRRSIARPQPSAWFVVPMATAGVATAFHVLTLAPRPPPSF